MHKWGGYAFISPDPAQRNVCMNFLSADYGTDCFAECYVYSEPYIVLKPNADFTTVFKYIYSQNLSQFNLLPSLDSVNVFNNKEHSYLRDNTYYAVLKSGLSAGQARASYLSCQQLIADACRDSRYTVSKYEWNAQSYFPNLKTVTAIFGLKQMCGEHMEHCYLYIGKDAENTFKITLEFGTIL